MIEKIMSYLSLGLATVMGLAVVGLGGSVVSADVVDDVTITVPEACNLSTDQGEGNTYTESMMNGQYKDNIGDTEFTVACNTEDSFAIYAIGYSGDEYGGTTMLSSDTNAGSTNTGQGVSNIPTGTATSGNTSQWAMKLTPVSGIVTPVIDNGYNNFSVVPGTYTKVASIANSMSYSNEAKVKATYAVYISPTQAAATYTGKVKYTVVHPNTAPAPVAPVVTNPGYISYNPNAAGVTDTMGDQAIATTDTSADLWASNFKRAGYGFAGWNDKFDYTGNNYGPNETISFTAGQYSGDNKGLSLYAIWVPSAGDLQGWTGCSTLNTDDVTALTDTRDNETYAVAKLADGNCWMIENLRLAGQDTNGNNIELTTENTNNPLSTSGAVTIKNSDSNTTNHLSTSTDPTTTAWCQSNSSACDDQSMIFTGNTTNPVANMTASNTSTAVYSYGNYYNWYSATAGNGTYSKSSGVTDGDICPTGWHLPYGGSATTTGGGQTSGGFSYLDIQLGGTGAYQSTTEASLRWRKYPNNFVYSGTVYGSSFSTRGTNGYYWSSTASSSNSAYTLVFRSSLVYPGTDYILKYYGRMVRCVASGV